MIIIPQITSIFQRSTMDKVKLALTTIFEHSLQEEGSLHNWVSSLTRLDLDLTKKENLLLFVCCEAVEFNVVKRETSCTVILPPMASVICLILCASQQNNTVTSQHQNLISFRVFQPTLYSYWRSSCSWRVRIGNFFTKSNVKFLKATSLEVLR